MSVPVEMPPYREPPGRVFTLRGLCFRFFWSRLLFSSYGCRRRPPAPSCGTRFCCPSGPAGRRSPGPEREGGGEGGGSKRKDVSFFTSILDLVPLVTCREPRVVRRCRRTSDFTLKSHTDQERPAALESSDYRSYL